MLSRKYHLVLAGLLGLVVTHCVLPEYSIETETESDNDGGLGGENVGGENVGGASASGGRESSSSVCKENSECGGDTPVCVNGGCSVCVPDTTECEEDSVAQCNSDGSGWDTLKQCDGATPSCHESECVVCVPESVTCEDNAPAVCLANATGWSVGSECQDATPACYDGACEHSRAVSIHAGGSHTCALLDNGSVQCWGSDYHGQIGDGGVAREDRFSPVDIEGLSDIRALAAGLSNTCVVLENKKVQCWGSNGSGKLGNGDTNSDPVFSPGDVIGLSNVASLAIGSDHVCALLEGGTMKCWGSNASGKLGFGSSSGAPKFSPVDVVGLTDAKEIGAGQGHTCALLNSGTVKCWGGDGYGEVGDGDTVQDRYSPVDVTDLSDVKLTDVVSISLGYMHTCALLSGGNVKCWGSDGNGQIGNGDSAWDTDNPVDAIGLADVKSISAGGYHTCALLDNGTVKCWGWDTQGQVGDGAANIDDKISPVLVEGLSGVESITSGEYHNCALLGDGGIKCWGGDAAGAIGDGLMTQDTTVPVQVYSF